MSESTSNRQPDKVVSGMEWETTVLVEDEGSHSPIMDGYMVTRAINNHRPNGWRAIGHRGSSRVFLENGGLLYQDVGNRLEYATPEEDSVTGAVREELTAEWFIGRMMQSIVASPGNSIHLAEAYKRTFSSGRALTEHKDGSIAVDRIDLPKSCGYHVNTGLPYQEGRTGISRSLLLAMGLHASTRMLYLGAGVVVPGRGGRDPDGYFSLSQRAPFISDDYSSNTTRHRPVLSNRDETLVAQRFDRWVRHHDINNDPVMSPWAMRMIYGTNRLILRLGLAGKHMTDHQPTEDFPLHRIFTQTSTDLTHQKPVELQSGTIKPIDIQWLLYEACLGLKERYDLDEGELWTLRQWDKGLADFENDPLRLRDRTDWVAKKHNLDGIKSKANIPEKDWTHPRLEMVDQSFSRLDATSRGAIMRDRVWNKWLPEGIIDRTDAEHRTPPQTTRAAIRGEFVRRHGALPGNDSHPDFTAEWTHVSVNKKYFFLRPFDTDVGKLDALNSSDIWNVPEFKDLAPVVESSDDWIGI